MLLSMCGVGVLESTAEHWRAQTGERRLESADWRAQTGEYWRVLESTGERRLESTGEYWSLLERVLESAD